MCVASTPSRVIDSDVGHACTGGDELLNFQRLVCSMLKTTWTVIWSADFNMHVEKWRGRAVRSDVTVLLDRRSQ